LAGISPYILTSGTAGSIEVTLKRAGNIACCAGRLSAGEKSKRGAKIKVDVEGKGLRIADL
jgi:hypothetical protein